MKATSINWRPAKKSAERHNSRAKRLNYARDDLKHLNQTWAIDTTEARLAGAAAAYEQAHGQRPQANANPIKEAVIVIDATTTMEQLREAARQMEERYGITIYRIDTHMDEGHYDAKTNEWVPNYHAQMLADWTCYDPAKKQRKAVKNHGKYVYDDVIGEDGRPQKKLRYKEVSAYGSQIRLKPADMAEMQSIVASCLGMQRGTPSSVKHLDAITYKVAAKAKDLADLEADHKRLETKVKGLTTMIANLEIKKSAVEAALQTAQADAATETESLQNQLDEITAKIAAKQQLLAEAKQLLETAKQSVSAKSDELDRLAGAASQANIQIGRAQGRLALLNQEVADSQADLNRINMERGAAYATLGASAVLDDLCRSIRSALERGDLSTRHGDPMLAAAIDHAGWTDDDQQSDLASQCFWTGWALTHPEGATLNAAVAAMLLGTEVSSGGGAVTSDMPWGRRRDDEDDEAYAHRAAVFGRQAAAVYPLPKSRKKGLKR